MSTPPFHTRDTPKTRSIVTASSGSGSSSNPLERHRDIAAQLRWATGNGGTSNTITPSTRVPLPPPGPATRPFHKHSANEEAMRIIRSAVAEMNDANTDPKRRAAIQAAADGATRETQGLPCHSVHSLRDKVVQQTSPATGQSGAMSVPYQYQERQWQTAFARPSGITRNSTVAVPQPDGALSNPRRPALAVVQPQARTIAPTSTASPYALGPAAGTENTRRSRSGPYSSVK